MKDVFITGRGLITPLGIGRAVNEKALREGKSGVSFVTEWAEHNLTSCVAGIVNTDMECPRLNNKHKRFTAFNSIMAVVAVEEALAEAKLTPEDIADRRIAVISGVAGTCYKEIFETTNIFSATNKLRKVNPCIVPRVMPSSAVANLSLVFGFTGESYDISAACASSAHAVILGTRMIQAGMYDIVVCGGAEQCDWIQALGFTAIRALATKYNDCPQQASRPFAADRDGFVLAEGAGFMVLESEASLKQRRVEAVSRISGYCGNSNATDMVVPDVKASIAAMRGALAAAGLEPQDIAYINTHGTATPIGDPVEMQAIKAVFPHSPAINSTKSQTGHMIGATGAVELIFTSLMIEKNFISPSLNLENPETEFEWADFVLQTRENTKIRHALSNSFAFGGSNASLIISAV
ncbi:MAG: beta-ketoacyl-[acyl-carrier-protein] synthase family protein [Victivallaceae bacterium]|nr:beta-ketoacyl-[acyl-carrier-protein] synthase family protein [Victivallaceae bacterium]